MKILHILNVADWLFMALGVGAALAMMIVGGHGGQREPDGAGATPVRRSRVRRT